ncbi:MAG TPA: FAD/NAD(P)-binding protein [Bacteroidia bacterium]|nr:FAD/NAD(P)-binding protein [Bacteroidia bacterium]
MSHSPQHQPASHTLHIAIIGGGFCGAMTLIHILKTAQKTVHVTLIHDSDILAKGIAYDTYSNEHVLNVEARNMSAFPDDPDHFVNWCRKSGLCNSYDQELLPFLYLPRNIYGKYLAEIYHDALLHIPHHVSLFFTHAEATDMQQEGDHFRILCSDGSSVLAHQVVLATGNNEPGHAALNGQKFIGSPKYFSNPWKEQAVMGLDSTAPVFIIGTGLTMVDVVIGLLEKNFSNKIYALSPKGFNILAHRPHHPQREILDELAPPYELEKLVQLFRKHVRKARAHGESGETVVDAVRSKTQEIWQSLALKDKHRFMSHVRHLWGVARHRLPGHIHHQVQQLIQEGKLEIIAGRILDLRDEDGIVSIQIRRRKSQDEETIRAARVINCTGPQSDILKFNSRLFQNLIRKGYIFPDEMNLGIQATADGRILKKDGSASTQLFAIGSLLRGKLWESTAVPELRKQALNLALLLTAEQ